MPEITLLCAITALAGGIFAGLLVMLVFVARILETIQRCTSVSDEKKLDLNLFSPKPKKTNRFSARSKQWIDDRSTEAGR